MKVSGYITDDYGKTDGASIQLIRDGGGTNVATTSNQDGYFEIDNDEINSDDIFEIRYQGLGNKKMKASELQDANIFLEEDVEQLDEIIINASIGKKPTQNKIKEWEQKWYTSPVFLLSVVALVSTGTIIYIIKKTK
tara:strand:- start:4744 stop:5154 length:411 start_codon:yes stop_codon:yes gene_type:complete